MPNHPNHVFKTSTIFLVRPSRPREFNIIYQDINSLTLRWIDPAHTHGTIDHFNVNMLTLFEFVIYSWSLLFIHIAVLQPD